MNVWVNHEKTFAKKIKIKFFLKKKRSRRVSVRLSVCLGSCRWNFEILCLNDDDTLIISSNIRRELRGHGTGEASIYIDGGGGKAGKRRSRCQVPRELSSKLILYFIYQLFFFFWGGFGNATRICPLSNFSAPI